MSGRAEEPDRGAEDWGREPGFRKRKRQDHALMLIEDLLANLGDRERVKDLLRQLGRFYDPVLGGAIVDIQHQRQIVEALERGKPEEARALIQARYEAYMKDRIHLGRQEGVE